MSIERGKVKMAKTLAGCRGRRSAAAAAMSLVTFLSMLGYHATTAASPQAVVSKCCLPGQVVSVSDNFTCAYSSASSRELYPLSRALHEGFACSNSANLTITVLDDVVGPGIRAPAACLDFIYDGENIPVIFRCQPNDDDGTGAATLPVPRLSNQRFCCGRTRVYDPKRRECVPRVRDFDVAEFFGFMDGSIEFVTVDRGPPKCVHAIVDYVVNVTRNPPRVLGNGSLEFIVPSKNGSIAVVATEKTSCLDPGDETPDLVSLRVCSGPSYCNENTCVRKCCPEDEVFFRNNCAKLPSNIPGVNYHSYLVNASIERGLNESLDHLNNYDYGLLIGRPCKYSMFAVSMAERWHMNPRGHVFVPTYRLYGHHDYCTDMFYLGTDMEGTFYPSVCFDSPDEKELDSPIRFGVNGILELISCAFLIVTLLVYICLPALQNLHGKTLMCHVASLIVAYGSTAAVALQVVDHPDHSERSASALCRFLGFTVLLTWIAAFSWLNVMCFDIWWTFGGLGGAAASGGRSRAYRKRFLMYSLYAWGVPLLITSIGVAVDVTEAIPRSVRPNIGTDICWFEQGTHYYGEVIFFLVPVTLQLISNVVFFVLTALHCSRVKAEISRVMSTPADPRNRRFRADRTKLIMNVKLFIVMGVTWTMEVTSAMVNHYAMDLSFRNELFYVSDVFNCLQGVLIFMLFVLKSKVYYALRRRLAGRMGNAPASNGGTGLQDPYRVRKSASSSTIMSTFAVSTSP